MKKNKDLVGLFLIILNLAGAIGLSTKYSSIFLTLVPYNLILTFLLCFFYVSIKKYYRPILLLFLIGYFIELIGVKTGFLFGEYSYGDTLGLKILDVPVVIGLNWSILCLATFSLFSVFIKNRFLLPFFSSICMVLLDFLIEPVAPLLDFWSWNNAVIPLSNYRDWFVVALINQSVLLENYVSETV